MVRRIRSEFPGPLVCYSDVADADARIAALTQGADDMVPNPVSYRELALRVRAVARCSDVGEPDADDDGSGRHHQRPANPGTHQVRRDDEWVQLTPVEFSLLAFLMRNPRTSFTGRQLLRQVWGYEIGDTSTVSVHSRGNAMRVVVTGGAGYIGSVTAAALIDAGYDVVAVDDL